MHFDSVRPLRRSGNPNWDADEVTRRLRDEVLPALGRAPIDLLMVITPSTAASKTSSVYAPIKRYCDCVAGIASQCVTLSNVESKHSNRAFAANLLMKINSKLGGINVSLREMPLALKTGTV